MSSACASLRIPRHGAYLRRNGSSWCGGCLYGEKNGGSRQWKAITAWLRSTRPEVTTVVSYSDPSAGHPGGPFRAFNWLWAPTWHRLREPPSGNGDWGTGRQAVKDRWVFCLTPDAEREMLLRVQD